jgi:CubicO group peptidase (beta-lactamase class C family)
MRWIGTFNPMQSLQDAVEHEVERTGFSGVVRLDRAGETEFCTAYGYADRARRVPNTVETLFATASGSKGLTALAVMSLVERGTLALGTTARSLLGTDLPLIADDVTVGHLLAHRSGIGDYLDEEAVDDISDYVMPVSVHELATTEQFLAVLDGHETAFPAGEEFAYNNGGYVVLALLAERASGVAFAELVRTLVCEPAGMVDTSFPALRRAPGTRRPRLPVGRRPENERVSSPCARQRRRGHLLDRCRPQRLLGLTLRRTDRLTGTGRRYGATAQRLAEGGQALRPRVPPRRDGRRDLARGVRRGRLVRQPAPAHVIDHLHRHLKLVRWCLADRQIAPHQARHLSTPARSCRGRNES